MPVTATKKVKVIVRPRKCEPEVVNDWLLAELTNHPLQHVYFAEPTSAEVEKLAANLQRNTQTDAVEITPSGIIISGHKRVLAARFLGWATIRVLVRYDLSGEDVAIEHRLIEANEDRRHLSTFERARLQYRMWQLCAHEDTRKARGQINDQLAETLDICVRQVSRYIRLFDGPQELVVAVQDGRLLPSHAFSVLQLTAEQMEPILGVLRDDPDNREVKEMVQAVTGNESPKKSNPAATLEKLLKAGGELAGHEAALTSLVTDSQRKSIAVVRRLLEKVEGKSSPAA